MRHPYIYGLFLRPHLLFFSALLFIAFLRYQKYNGLLSYCTFNCPNFIIPVQTEPIVQGHIGASLSQISIMREKCHITLVKKKLEVLYLK